MTTLHGIGYNFSRPQDGFWIGLLPAYSYHTLPSFISPGMNLKKNVNKSVLMWAPSTSASVAIILQIFYNYIIAKIDSIVNDMEDASISLVDLLVDRKK